MNLRKINAPVSLIVLILFFDHAIFYSIWMLSRCSIEKSISAAPIVLTILALFHAFLSLAMAVLAHKGEEKPKQPYKSYTKLNIKATIQRWSGIAILVLVGLHIAGAGNHFHPKLIHTFIYPVFFAVTLLHVAVSSSKAFITLGVGNAKFVKILDRLMYVICTLIFIAGCIGFYQCLFLGVAK